MTNTESRIAVGLEELASWDDDEALTNDEKQITEADIRELAVYGFDSEKQTLVGLGPVERARRSRRKAEIPDSERMPQSEPPGPFVADDDEMPRSWRGRELRPWAFAVPTALLVAAAAVALVHGVAPEATTPSKAGVPATAPQSTIATAPPPPLAPELPPPTALAPPLDTVSAPEAELPIERDDANEQHESQRAPARLEVAPRGATVNVSVAAPPLPVKLPELPPPAVLDISGGTNASVGTIDVVSSPPANVVLDGRPLGKAPRLVQVPPGTHTVLFIHPLYGRQSLSVKVAPGRTSSAAAEF